MIIYSIKAFTFNNFVEYTDVLNNIPKDILLKIIKQSYPEKNQMIA